MDMSSTVQMEWVDGPLFDKMKVLVIHYSLKSYGHKVHMYCVGGKDSNSYNYCAALAQIPNYQGKARQVLKSSSSVLPLSLSARKQFIPAQPLPIYQWQGKAI